jgi:hypothetical protein
LKVAVVVMGVLLVAGTATLAFLIARRVPSLAGGGGAASSSPFHAVLDEPAGTRIAGVVAIQDRLAVQLQGGGPDRVIVLDPRTGLRSGAVLLAR